MSEKFYQIFDKTIEDLEKIKDENGLDHDGTINFSMMFIEKLIPRILECYERDAYEAKCKQVATQLRIVISAIMPINKFMDYMNMNEMKAVDGIIKALEEGGLFNFDESKLDGLFKPPGPAPNIYG